VFKRGKATPDLGSFHASDLAEFYGAGDAPDFIGTDAVGMFSGLVLMSVLVGLTTALIPYIQSTLPILVILQSHTTLAVFSLL
jgi:hypothetical protein